MSYFHGGVPGLRLGAEILPPSITGVVPAVAYGADLPGHEVVRTDRVFLGSLDVALIYAAMYPTADGGWIYEVEPVGDLEPDPDYSGPDGDSVQAERAVIVRVLGPLAPSDVDMVRRVLSGLVA